MELTITTVVTMATIMSTPVTFFVTDGVRFFREDGWSDDWDVADDSHHCVFDAVVENPFFIESPSPVSNDAPKNDRQPLPHKRFDFPDYVIHYLLH